MKNTIIGVVLMLISLNLSAANSGERKISRVQVAEGWFAIHPDKPFDNKKNCEDVTTVIFWEEDFPKSHDQMLSTALTAFASDKKISMWLRGCKMGVWGKTLPHAGTINLFH